LYFDVIPLISERTIPKSRVLLKANDNLLKIKGIFFLSVNNNILGIFNFEFIKSSKLLLFNSTHLLSTNFPK